MDPNTSSPPVRSLPRLATELIMMIAEDLGLGDRFNLSKTSRRLREIFWQKSKKWNADLSGLPHHKRLEFWTTVTRGHPHLIVDHSSLDMGRSCVRRFEPWRDRPYFFNKIFRFTDIVDSLHPNSFFWNSTLRRDHVRAALKLHRLLGSDNTYSGDILAAASKSFTIKGNPHLTFFDGATDAAQRLGVCLADCKYDVGFRFETKASISRYHRRFQLDLRIEASGEWKRLPLIHNPRLICRHLCWTLRDPRRMVANPEVVYNRKTKTWKWGRIRKPDIDRYRGREYYRMRDHCDLCLTEYDVRVEPRQFSMHVWYDLGREEDDDDVCVRSGQIAVARRS